MNARWILRPALVARRLDLPRPGRPRKGSDLTLDDLDGVISP
jgi:hypothetical protein